MSNIFQRAQRKIAFILANTLTLLALGFAGPGIAYAQDGVAVPIRADIGQTIQLDPSDGFSAAAAGVLTPVWSWVSRPAVSVAEFSDAGVLRPFVTPDVAGVYVARLDMFLDGSSEPVESILAAFGTENLAPVAQVRGRALPDGEGALTLDGSASYDVDGDALTYSWSVVSAPADSDVVFATPTAPLTEISFTGSGEFVFGLTVQDSFGYISAVDTFAVDIGAGQLGRSCTAETATLLPNSGAQRVTFDIGDMTNGPAVNYVIPSFDTDRGGETSFDTLNFTYLGVPYSLSTVQSFVDFVGYFETDGDNTSDAIISKNSNERYLCFTFGTGRGSVLLENVVDRDLTRKKLLAQSVDFPEIQDFFLSQYDVTLPNSGARNVSFDLGDVTNGPAVNYLIPSFDTDRGGERSFDTLTFTYRGKSYALSTVQDFLWFTGFIEHDGDRLSDALISENAAVDHLTFTFGANRSSVTLENVIDRHLKRSKLKRRSVDYYEPPLTQTVGGMRAVAPVASFGFDGVRGTIGDGIVLDGYASTDLDGGALSADVSLVAAPVGSAPTVTLGTDGFVSVTADTAGDYLVSLGVSDGLRDSADHLVVSVDGNLRPVARIAPTGLAALGQEIVLDGTQSYDLNGDMVAHAWSILSAPAASVAQIGDAQSALATFTPDVDGTYVLQLIVTDDLSTSVPTTVVIIPGAPLPLADAGPDQRVDAAGSAILDGGLSSVDQGTFAWSVLGLSQGGAAALADATQIIPTVTLPSGTTGGFLPSVVQLVVADSNGIALPDTVVASGGMIRPTVVAGTKMTATVGQPVDLMASDYGFDANGDPLSYRWSLIQRPIGSAASIVSVSSAQTVASPTLSFVADRTGFYLIQLEANDGHLNAVPAVIVLEVTNSAPTAVAAAIPDTFIGTSAVLDGSASFDPDNNALNYFWAVTSRPAGSTAFIADPAAAVTSFTPDVKGNYTFALSVSDFELSSVPATTSLSVPNQAPTIALVPPMSTAVGNIAVFDASASTDPDGDPLTFGIDVAGPVGSAAQTTELPGGVFEVGLDVAGDYTVTVSVSDGIETVPETISFTVAPGNGPPILGDLRDVYTVELGLELALDLTAVDPDGDLVTFFADPLPLPTGVSLDAATGALRYRPEAGQEDDYTLTLGVSDGTLTDVADVTITVVPGTASDTSVFGVVLDAVDFGNGITTPLVGMPVRLEAAALQVTTDANGRFDFGSLTAGRDIVTIDPDGAGAPGGYIGTERQITVTANQERDLSPAFLLMPFNEGCAPVVAGLDTILTGSVTGAQITIPADTILAADGTPFVGEVCLGSLPQQTPLDSFPEDTLACQVYGLSAPGASFSAGVSITAPNYDNLPETTQLTFWQKPADSQRFMRLPPQEALPVSGSVSSNRPFSSGGSPEAVFDRNISTFVATRDSESEFIEIDLGADKQLSVVTVTNAIRSSFEGLNGASVVVYDSARDEVFRSAPITGASIGGVERYEFGVPIGGQYIRVEQSNQSLYVAEITAFQYVAPREASATSRSQRFTKTASALVDPGTVTVEAASVDMLSDRVLFTFLPQAPQTVASDDQPTGNRELSVFQGDLSETYTLPGYFAFNRQQQVGLSYHSTAADPTVVVAGDVAIADNASLPVTMSTRIAVGGLSIASDVDWTPRQKADGSTPALIGEAVSMRQSMPVDATGLSSGRYPYTFLATANYDCSTVSAQHAADLYVQNEVNSPYGTGWSIDGLQKLSQSPDGSVAITDDDEIVTFDPKPTFTEFEDEKLVFPGLGVRSVVATDYDRDGDLDVVFSESGPGNISFLENRSNRDFAVTGSINVAEPPERGLPQTGLFFPNLSAVKSGNVTSDDAPDLAFTTQFERGIGLLINDGTGNFDIALDDTGFPETPTDVEIADLDRDGLDDILYQGDVGDFISTLNRVYVVYGDDLDAGLVRIVQIRTGRRTPSLSITTADINGNGELDILFRTTRGISFVFNDGNREYRAVEHLIPIESQRRIAVLSEAFDANGDELLDIVVSGTDGLFYYQNMDGETFAPPVELPRPPQATGVFNGLRVADTNGDGLDDIIFSTADEAQIDEGTVAVYESNGDGTFKPFAIGLIDYPFDFLEVVDVDGDGSLDLVSTQRFSVTVHFSKPTASGKFLSSNGEFSELTKLPDGTWERRYKDGMVVVFDATGLQTAEIDPQGNRREFAYGEDSRLETVTDQVGGVTSFTYDAVGRLATTTYPDGRTTTFEYDDDTDVLIQITQPDDSNIQYRYDDDGRLVAVTDERGNVTEHTYNAVGRYAGSIYPNASTIQTQAAASLGLESLGAGSSPLSFVAPEDRITTHTDDKGGRTLALLNEFGAVIQTFDPIGRRSFLERDAQNRVTQIVRPTSADGLETRTDQMDYDNRGNLTQMRSAVGTPLERSKSYAYEPTYNRVIRQIDYAGNETLYEYDQFGELIRMVDPEGGEETYTYNPFGLLASRTDERGHTTVFEYDSRLNVELVTLPDGSQNSMIYDASGNMIAFTQASGTPQQRTLVRTYDRLNRVTSEEVLDANDLSIDGKSFFEYDDGGNLTSLIDETGLVTDYFYNTMNELVSDSIPGFGSTTYSYNAAGELISEVDPEGHTTTYAYDIVGRMTQMVDKVGNVTVYTYDASDKPLTVEDARGNFTTFAYDVLDRRISRTNPLNQVMQMGYDSRDNLVQMTREDGAIETASYDGLSRRLSVATPDNTITYSYDAVGNLTGASDADSALVMTYDIRDRLDTIETVGNVGPQPSTILTYTYDALGQRVTLADSLGGTWDYSFDEKSRVSRIDTPWADTHLMDYDQAGRPIELTNATGRASLAAYDEDRLVSLEHFQSGVPVSRSGYAYAPDGAVSLLRDLEDPSLSETLFYDAANRLVQVSEGTPVADGGTSIPSEDYAYDPLGNRTATHLSNVYVVDDHNRLLEDAAYTYEYDIKGNRTERTRKSDGVTETFAYNAMNQLIGFESSAGTVATYAYDALGRRIAKTVDGVTTAYVYDIGNMRDLTAHDRLLEFVDGTLSKRWLHGQEIDQPLAFEAYSSDTTPGAGTAYSLHGDRQGSIIAVTNQATGALAARYVYDAFGGREITVSSVAQDMGFTGREYDAETGLYYYRARHYDPLTGRFLQSDPLGFGGGDMNLYAYTWNDPANWTDPSGLSPSTNFARLTAGTANLARGVSARVGAAARCVANRISTALAGVARVVALGRDLHRARIRAHPRISCRTQVVAPRCGCKSRGGGLGAGASGSSFVRGTEVRTPSGPVAIETLREGDMVIARDEDGGITGIYPVTAIMQRQTAAALYLTLENGAGETSVLGVTAEHPLYDADAGWTEAGDLVAGDIIVDRDMQPLTLLAIWVDDTPQLVHNLEVGGAHTYFAGEMAAWAHNAGREHRFAAPRIRCATRKEAYERAKHAGGGAEPRLDFNDPRGPHYHPNVPNACSTSGRQPNSHWHYFFPRGR